ncbi:hypothetical protein PAPHI01_1823 [Pancytospora philotis]|nr:hypothetical protein PAPHI01_1823 [Pancytospora philotis]
MGIVYGEKSAPASASPGEHSTEDASSEAFEDSQASFVYNSAESEGSSSSAYSDDEENYFGAPDSGDASDESGIAWVDSDEDSELQAELPTEAAWLSTEGLAKKVQRKGRRIGFKLQSKVFTTKYRIRAFRAFKDFKIAVDSFNIVYWINTFDDFKAFRISDFKITDFALLGDRLLLASDNSAFMKQLGSDGKVVTVNKRTGKVRRMCVGGPARALYIAGDKLFRFDRNLVLKGVFNQQFVDLCVGALGVFGLKSNGDVLVFDHQLVLQRKLSFDHKFEFRRVFCTDTHLYLGTETGFYVLNDQLVQTKEFHNIKGCATGFGCNPDFTVYASDDKNSLRIIKEGLLCYDRFPFSKVYISPISFITMDGDTVYFSHSRYLSTLKLEYV